MNSAISLALQGLGEGIKTMNFITPTLIDRLPDWLKIEVGSKTEKETKEGKHKESKIKLDNDFKSPLTKVEKNLIRGLGSTALIFIVYIIFSIVLSNQIENKSTEISTQERNIETKISAINSDISKISKKTADYRTAIENIQKLNEHGYKPKSRPI